MKTIFWQICIYWKDEQIRKDNDIIFKTHTKMNVILGHLLLVYLDHSEFTVSGNEK